MSDYPLVTVDEARTYLGLGTSDDETHLLEDYVSRATDYCEWYCDRLLAARLHENKRFAPIRSLSLRPLCWPIDVTQTIAIAIDAVVQTVWKQEGDGDRNTFDVLVRADTPEMSGPNIFWRKNGWCGTTSDPEPILITYTGGIDPIPGELKDACYLVIGNMHNAQEKKLAEIAAFGSGPVNPSVTYRLGSDLIPLKAKQILDSYRRWL